MTLWKLSSRRNANERGSASLPRSLQKSGGAELRNSHDMHGSPRGKEKADHSDHGLPRVGRRTPAGERKTGVLASVAVTDENLAGLVKKSLGDEE